MTTRPVAVRVSAATRLYGSCSRQASRMASETWSAILSGCPSVTDSEVNKKRSLNFRLLPIEGIQFGGVVRSTAILLLGIFSTAAAELAQSGRVAFIACAPARVWPEPDCASIYRNSGGGAT